MLLESLDSYKESFKSDSQKMRRAIRWSNYKPVTNSLKNSEDVIYIKRDLPKIALQEEKRIYTIIKQSVTQFNKKKENALNVVPPKMCLDFKRKLKNKFELLDQKFDYAILDLLKQKANTQKVQEETGNDQINEKESINTGDQENKSRDQLLGIYLLFQLS